MWRGRGWQEETSFPTAFLYLSPSQPCSLIVLIPSWFLSSSKGKERHLSGFSHHLINLILSFFLPRMLSAWPFSSPTPRVLPPHPASPAWLQVPVLCNSWWELLPFGVCLFCWMWFGFLETVRVLILLLPPFKCQNSLGIPPNGTARVVRPGHFCLKWELKDSTGNLWSQGWAYKTTQERIWLKFRHPGD